MKNNKSKAAKKDINLSDHSWECIFLGLIVILVALIGFINKGPVGNFITYILVYLTGAFYFLFFLAAFASGIYLIIRKKSPKIHISMKILGLIFVLVSALIISSGDSSVLLKNFASSYQHDYIEEIRDGAFKITQLGNIVNVGGGFLGFFLRGFLNTCITNTGTIVVCAILFFVGFVLLLKDVIAYIIRFFVNYPWKKEKPLERKEMTPSFKEDSKSLPEETPAEEEKVSEEKEEVKPIEEHAEIVPPVSSAPAPQVSLSSFFEDEVSSSSGKTSFFEDDNDDGSVTASTSYESEFIQKEKTESEERIEPVKEEASFFSEEEENEKEEYSSAPVTESAPKEEKEDVDLSSFMKTAEPETPPMEEAPVNEKAETVVLPEEKPAYVRPAMPVVPEPEEKPASADYGEVVVAPAVKETLAPAPAPVQEAPKQAALQEKEAPKPVVKKKAPYLYPPFDLLRYHPGEDTSAENRRVADERVVKINHTFETYKIGAQVISYTVGPSVTRFNVRMNEGVRVSTLSTVKDEISIALNGNKTVRVELVVEGRDTSSIEVGNDKPSPVSFKEVFDQIKDRNSVKDKLLIPLGKDIEGKVVTTHMDELPHLLVAGTTGSGKSVFVNTIIATFIMRNSPEELRLILIDPKKVEFSRFNGLPHLLCPIITESKDGNVALKKLCDVMDERYEKFSHNGVTKISEYNEIAEENHFEKMCNIVVIVDEYADFLSNGNYAKEIEGSIQRLCQKARACGIYLIICTQRPSVNIITGAIKAVIPSRIGLLVPSYVDSKTILDTVGAESLLGNGDMLCSLPRHSSLVRVQGSYVSSKEIVDLCNYIKAQRDPEFDPRFENLNEPAEDQLTGGFGGRKKELDPLHEEAKKWVIEHNQASTSSLQSYFGIGYGRADHILNCLEEEGVVKRVNGGRRIVIHPGDPQS